MWRKFLPNLSSTSSLSTRSMINFYQGGEKGEYSGKNVDDLRIVRLPHPKVIIFGIDNDLDKCYYTINSERQSILLA
jgi:hypothetical protein